MGHSRYCAHGYTISGSGGNQGPFPRGHHALTRNSETLGMARDHSEGKTEVECRKKRKPRALLFVSRVNVLFLAEAVCGRKRHKLFFPPHATYAKNQSARDLEQRKK